MIELPEAITIAGQMAQAIAGRVVVLVERNNASHKFAFYSGSPEWYAQTLVGRRLGVATAQGSLVMLPAGDDYVLVLGGGGERITHHSTPFPVLAAC